MEEMHLKELDNAAIGARIRARRESLDMTRADLAGRIPLNEKSVAEIEYGNRGLSLKTLFRLKQILGVSTDYILEGDPEGLTEEEKAEQAGLRAEYVAAMKQSLRSQLDSTVIVRPDGTRQPLKKNGR